MNNSQRNFLIEKIEQTAKIKMEALDVSDSLKPPSLGLFLFHEVMSGKAKIIDNAKIMELIRQKALKGTDRDDWLGNPWHSGYKKGIFFELTDFFIVPEEWKRQNQEYEKQVKKARDQKAELSIEVDTIITRIKLASNSTLEQMIREVDDMGNISLMDTKLKQLTS